MPRVYIGRLSYNVREKDIQRFFSGYGKLMEVDLKNGYGFVEFEDNRDADDAVYELNGKELCGERVIVEHARGPRRDRDGQSGGYGGGRSKWSLLQDTPSSLSPRGEVSVVACTHSLFDSSISSFQMFDLFLHYCQVIQLQFITDQT